VRKTTSNSCRNVNFSWENGARTPADRTIRSFCSRTHKTPKFSLTVCTHWSLLPQYVLCCFEITVVGDKSVNPSRKLHVCIELKIADIAEHIEENVPISPADPESKRGLTLTTFASRVLVESSWTSLKSRPQISYSVRSIWMSVILYIALMNVFLTHSAQVSRWNCLPLLNFHVAMLNMLWKVAEAFAIKKISFGKVPYTKCG